MEMGSEVEKIDTVGDVAAVVDLLRRSMPWGAVDALLLRKDMTVSDGWDGRS